MHIPVKVHKGGHILVPFSQVKTGEQAVADGQSYPIASGAGVVSVPGVPPDSSAALGQRVQIANEIARVAAVGKSLVPRVRMTRSSVGRAEVDGCYSLVAAQVIRS